MANDDKRDWQPYQEFAYEQLAITGVASGLTNTVYRSAKRAVIVVEFALVRFRCDGIAPTASLGELLYPRDEIVLLGADINNAKFIAVDFSSPLLNCTYGR